MEDEVVCDEVLGEELSVVKAILDCVSDIEATATELGGTVETLDDAEALPDAEVDVSLEINLAPQTPLFTAPPTDDFR